MNTFNIFNTFNTAKILNFYVRSSILLKFFACKCWNLKLGTCHIVSLKCNSETDVACTPVGFSVPASPASAGLAARRCSLPTTIYLQSPPPTDTGGRHGNHGDAPTSNERGSSPIMKTHNCKIDNRSNINKLYGWRWRQPKTSYSS